MGRKKKFRDAVRVPVYIEREERDLAQKVADYHHLTLSQVFVMATMSAVNHELKVMGQTKHMAQFNPWR